MGNRGHKNNTKPTIAPKNSDRKSNVHRNTKGRRKFVIVMHEKLSPVTMLTFYTIGEDDVTSANRKNGDPKLANIISE